jgi:predicted RecA/RadA family phage recombinase
MKNFVQKGCTILIPAIASAIASGELVVVGATVGVSAGAYAIGEDAVLNLDGVFQLPKAASGAMTQGAKVYVASGLITTTVGSNVFVGYVHEAVADGVSVVNVLLAR